MYNNTVLTISKRVDAQQEEKCVISAVVLVNTEVGSSQDIVLQSLKLVVGVEEAHALYGVYDLIIKIKALTMII
jgi:hypothetical protein